jgi:hypothetical protein
MDTVDPMLAPAYLPGGGSSTRLPRRLARPRRPLYRVPMRSTNRHADRHHKSILEAGAAQRNRLLRFADSGQIEPALTRSKGPDRVVTWPRPRGALFDLHDSTRAGDLQADLLSSVEFLCHGHDGALRSIIDIARGPCGQAGQQVSDHSRGARSPSDLALWGRYPEAVSGCSLPERVGARGANHVFEF